MATNRTASPLLLLLPFLLLLLSPAAAHNITRILDQFPEFSAFNTYLNQTGIASMINSRTTITVLAVDNSSIGGLSGQPADVLEHILSVHVILDYFDAQKLHKLSKKSALVTTLFQSSGIAAGRAGFLNVTVLPDGQVAFGSAVLGAGLTAKFVKELVTRPYNISVLQVSGVIYPPNIIGVILPPPPPPAPASAPKIAPTPAAAPAESVSPAPTDAETPVGAPEADSPGPSADEVHGPSSDAPTASSPSPTESVADAPAAKGGKAQKSSGGRVATGASLAVVIAAAVFGAL